nr:tape measure protein [Pseudomonas sp. s4]
MSEKVIASLIGKLRFDVDSTGLRKFEKMLDGIHAKMAALDKQATRLQKKLGIAPKGMANIQRQLAQQQKLTKQQFQDSLKASKLQLAVDQNKLKLQSVQAKTATQQAKQQAQAHKAELERAKVLNAQRMFGLRQEQQALRLQQEKLRLAASNSRLEATRARTQAAADRARITALRLEERLSRRLPRGLQPAREHRSPWRSGGRGFGSSVGHVLAGGAGVGIGAQIPGLGMFTAGLHPAALALGVLATATTAAAVALNNMAKIDVAAGDTRAIERKQLQVLTKGDTQAAGVVEQDLTGFANELGLLREKIAKPFVMSAINLTDAGLQREESVGLIKGIMRFARGTGTNEDDMGGALRAIGQAFSKGQLYAEEWKGQFAERIAGADKLGVEAWAKVTGSGLTGQKAKAAFSDAMSDGKISGEMMNKFFVVLGKMMDDKSNLEGRLDTIAASAESSAARIANLKEERRIATSEYNDGQLKQSSIELFQAKERLERSLNKLIPTFSSLESASLRFEARFYDFAFTFVNWLSVIQTKLDSFEPSPEFLRFIEAVSTTLDKLYVALEPVLTLMSDVVTFMAGIAIDTFTESWKTFFGTFADGLEGMQGILDSMPDAVQQFVDHIRDMIAKLLDMVGLGDRWRKHQQEREQDRQASNEVEQLFKIPFMSTAITPELQRSISQLSGPSPALQNAIDNKTVNTTGVLQFNPSITINAESADASEVVAQLESKLQGMAQDAYRGMLQQTLDKTKTSLVQTKK